MKTALCAFFFGCLCGVVIAHGMLGQANLWQSLALVVWVAGWPVARRLDARIKQSMCRVYDQQRGLIHPQVRLASRDAVDFGIWFGGAWAILAFL